jgi:hypothetical protein
VSREVCIGKLLGRDIFRKTVVRKRAGGLLCIHSVATEIQNLAQSASAFCSRAFSLGMDRTPRPAFIRHFLWVLVPRLALKIRTALRDACPPILNVAFDQIV